MAKFGGIEAKHTANQPRVEYRRMYRVLDGVGHLLYAAGFHVPIGGDMADTRPAKPFSRPHDLGWTPRYYSTQFTWSFRDDDSIECSVEYDPQEVWVVFERVHITSLAKPSFPVSDELRQKMQTLADQIAGYLREQLPASYHVTVSLEHPAT